MELTTKEHPCSKSGKGVRVGTSLGSSGWGSQYWQGGAEAAGHHQG